MNAPGQAPGGNVSGNPFAVFVQLEPLLATKMSLFNAVSSIKSLLFWGSCFEIFCLVFAVVVGIPTLLTINFAIGVLYLFVILKILAGAITIFGIWISEISIGDIFNNVLQTQGANFDIPFDVRDRMRNLGIYLFLYVGCSLLVLLVVVFILVIRIMIATFAIFYISIGPVFFGFQVEIFTYAWLNNELWATAFQMPINLALIVLSIAPALYLVHLFFSMPPRARDIVMGIRHAEFLPWNKQ
jgi:hypothetical protein